MRDDLSNVDIVLYALFKLEGYKRSVHTEDVAYEAYNLANERFGWRLLRYREMNFPDKEPVRIALEDAKKKKYGHLVEGRAGVEMGGKQSDGWLLTAEGVAHVRSNVARLEAAFDAPRSSIRKEESSRFLKQIKGQPLFAKFISKGTLAGESPYALTDMLATSPDAPKEVLAMKLQRLRSTAELVGDHEVIRFVAECGNAFRDFLGPTYQRQEGE